MNQPHDDDPYGITLFLGPLLATVVMCILAVALFLFAATIDGLGQWLIP